MSLAVWSTAVLQHLSRAHTFLSPRPRFTTFTSTGVDYTYELHREISPPRNGVINASTFFLLPFDTFALYFSLLFSSPSLFLFPLLIRGRARTPTRHERNHKSFSLQLGDASSGKKLFGVSRSVTLPVVCVPILFSSIRILRAPKAPQSFPLRVL